MLKLRLQRLFTVGLGVCCLTGLSGCFSIHQTVTLNEDGSGTIRFELLENGMMESVSVLGGLSDDKEDKQEEEKNRQERLEKLKKGHYRDLVPDLITMKAYEIAEARAILKKTLHEKSAGKVQLVSMSKKRLRTPPTLVLGKKDTEQTGHVSSTVAVIRFASLSDLQKLTDMQKGVSFEKTANGFTFSCPYSVISDQSDGMGPEEEDKDKEAEMKGDEKDDNSGKGLAFAAEMLTASALASEWIRLDVRLPGRITESNGTTEEGNLVGWEFPLLDVVKGKVRMEKLWARAGKPIAPKGGGATMMLKDGTILRGELLGFKEGVFAIKTADGVKMHSKKETRKLTVSFGE